MISNAAVPKVPRKPDIEQLKTIEPALRTLPAGSVLWRIYFRGGKHVADWHDFRRFGPTTNARFDHHEDPPRIQDRSVFYAACEPATCVAEVFQRGSRRGIRVVNRQYKEPWLVGFSTEVPLQLLDLTGTGKFLTRAGASMGLNTGPRSVSRTWARAFYAVYPHAAGLLYPSSMHGNEPAMVLTDRAEAAGVVPKRPSFHRALNDPALHDLLKNIARDLNYLLGPPDPGSE